MATVYFEELNGTDASFDSDEDGIIYEIGEYFAVFIPSAKYDYRFRNHLWDGKIRFANTRKQTIPVGLKGELQKFCAERNYEFVDTTKENPYTTDSLDGFDAWVQTLNLPFPPRDYQLASAKEAIKQKRLIVLSPTGCHAKGTKIIMADGSTKAVEDIREGEFVMGRDQEPKKVLRTFQGFAPLYKIQPNGLEPFVVNNEHVIPVYDIKTDTERFVYTDYMTGNKTVENLESLRLVVGRKQPSYVPFTVEALDGIGSYFGFECRDNLYYTNQEVLNHNSGKSYSLYLLLRWHHDKGRRVCLIVPNVSLVEQMFSDFANYSKDDPNFNVEDSLQMLYAKKSKEIDDSKHLITTWQSLQTYTADVYNSFDVMMADECHRCKASILQKILKQATDVQIRYGFTGSLSAEPTDNLTVTGSLGPVYTATTTTDLQARGELAPLRIYCLTINHTKDDCRYVAKEAKEYQQEIAYLVENDKRNKFIRNMACSLKGVVLVIFKHIEHGHRLYDLIKEKVGDSREVFFIDGSVDDREDIRQAIINGKDAILVASVGTTSTGVNIPNLQHIILAHPSKSRIQTIQTIGRSLRTHKSKNMAYVYDVIDNLKFGKRRNFVLKHALERFKIYSEQGFDVEFKEVSF